jgi:phage terminase large subunit GpA-like protein
VTALAFPRQVAPEAAVRWRARRGEIARAAFAPRSRLTLSQWADQRRMLSADLGEPGLWKTSRVPYMREIMDAVTDMRVRDVTIIKPTRIGATQAVVVNACGYHVDEDPAPIIVALPVEGDAKKFSTQLLQPAFDDTPCLQGKLDDVRSKRKRATMLEKAFAGGTLQIIGTKSPRAMRMVHGRVILMSEIDAWEFTAGTEGAPDKILIKRAGSYGNPKFVRESSPLFESTSRIKAYFNMGTQEYFHVPCPHCTEFQVLEWGGRDVAYGLKWDASDPKTAHYVCKHCSCTIDETLKHQMTSRGIWVATHPERVDHRSFQLNALVSPFAGARWPLLVGEWLETKGKPEKLRVFVNTVLGETYHEEGAGVDEKLVADRHHPYKAQVPMGVGKLVASVDVQGDRLERLVVGFGDDEELFPIEHEIIEGDPGIPERSPGSPWTKLTELRKRTYRHESGALLSPTIEGIDLGGHHSKEVHTYVRKHRAEGRLYGIKGSSVGEGAPLVSQAKYSNTGKAFYYMLGVFTAKEAVMKRLEKLTEPGPGYIHIPDWMDAEHIAQLTAEELKTSFKGGRPKRTWVKKRDRNEFLDLVVYAFCLLHALGPAIVRNLGDAARGCRLRRAAGEDDRTDDSVDAPPADPDPPPEPRSRRRGGWMKPYR